MPYPWFRVYNTIIYDPKMRRLTMPQRWLWIGLLAISSGSPTRGTLEICEGAPYTARDLALALCATPRQIEDALRQFRLLGMIEVRQTSNGPLVVIAHWAAYQYEASSLRAQKHRRAKAQARAAAGDSATVGGAEDDDAEDDGVEDAEDGVEDDGAEDAEDGTDEDAAADLGAAEDNDPARDALPPGRASRPAALLAPPSADRAARPVPPGTGEGGLKQTPATLAQRNLHAARNALSKPDTDPDSDAETDIAHATREGTIIPSLTLPPAREAPGPQDRAGEDDDDPAAADAAPEDAAEWAADGDDDGPPSAAPPSAALHSWLVEDAIATCARKWAPCEDPKLYVHRAFKLWIKTDLDEERMVRAVKKAVAVTEVRLEKKLIHTGAYMNYLLEVLRREVLPETRSQRAAADWSRRR